MWHVGQKVVCVEARTALWSGCTPDLSLEAGRIYTLLGVKESCCGVGILLLVDGPGITICPVCDRSHAANWKHERRFRPLDTLSLDMERIEKEGCPDVRELQTV